MNEHGFTKAVLAKVPSYVHRQSMTGAALANNGTPDRYLDYQLDLWVEFKFLKPLPPIIHPFKLLSPLQRRWLERRHVAGGNAVVILGFQHPSLQGAHGLWLNHAKLWRENHTIPRDVAIDLSLPVPHLAAELTRRVTR